MENTPNNVIAFPGTNLIHQAMAESSAISRPSTPKQSTKLQGVERNAEKGISAVLGLYNFELCSKIVDMLSDDLALAPEFNIPVEPDVMSVTPNELKKSAEGALWEAYYSCAINSVCVVATGFFKATCYKSLLPAGGKKTEEVVFELDFVLISEDSSGE